MKWIIALLGITCSAYAAEKQTKPHLLDAALIQALQANDEPAIQQALAQKPTLITDVDEDGNTLLHLAVMQGNEKLVLKLLEQNAHVNAHNKYHQTPLMKAAQYGRLTIAQELLQHHAKLNAQDIHGLTPLMLAAAFKHASLVTLLIDKGAEITLRDAEGWGLRAFARIRADAAPALVMGKQLFPQTIQPNSTAEVLAAIAAGQEDQILHLQIIAMMDEDNITGLTTLVPFVKTSVLNSTDKNLLMWALAFNHQALVRTLLAIPVDVNIQDPEGITPLMAAIFNGNIDTVKLLVKAGAKLNAQNMFGMTALALAIEFNHKEIARFLLQQGADFSIQDKLGNTALALAVAHKDEMLMIALIKKGADINKRNNAGTTPLMVAAHVQAPSFAKFLAFSGADVNAHDYANHTVFDYATTTSAKRALKKAIDQGIQERLKRMNPASKIQPLPLITEEKEEGEEKEIKQAATCERIV